MLQLWQECLEPESEDVNVELVQVKDFDINSVLEKVSGLVAWVWLGRR